MLWTVYFRRQNSTYLISFVQNWILRQKAKNWYLPQCEQRQPNISFTTIHLKQKLGGNSRWFLAKIQTFEGNHQVWKWIHLFQPENNRKTFSKWSFQFWSMRSRCIDKKKIVHLFVHFLVLLIFLKGARFDWIYWWKFGNVFLDFQFLRPCIIVSKN